MLFLFTTHVTVTVLVGCLMYKMVEVVEKEEV